MYAKAVENVICFLHSDLTGIASSQKDKSKDYSKYRKEIKQEIVIFGIDDCNIVMELVFDLLTAYDSQYDSQSNERINSIVIAVACVGVIAHRIKDRIRRVIKAESKREPAIRMYKVKSYKPAGYKGNGPDCKEMNRDAVEE